MPMNNKIWTEHLLRWKQFLERRFSEVEDKGEQIKIDRQLKTLERVHCGAVLNPKLLTEFISPSNNSHHEICCDEFSLCLNQSQEMAVQAALGDSELTLIQGPPGTGKTQVIAEVCLQLYKRNPGIRILVCSETHVAVNNLIERIAKKNNSIRIVRIKDKENDNIIDTFSPQSLITDYMRWASVCIKDKDALKIITDEFSLSNGSNDKSLEKALALSANVVGMTCNRVAAYDFRYSTEMFDVAIIDEVCKATLPEILTPLLVARRAILLGDPKQLPPVFCTEERNIIRQIDACNLDKYMYIDDLFKKSEAVVMLDTQYRMSLEISKMISTLFYEGKLHDGRNEKIHKSLTWVSYTPTQQWPELQEENNINPRIYNKDECSIISNLVNQMHESDCSLTIGIIAPYRAQVSLLKSRIKDNIKIKIDTVDGFQGKECDVIIYSVTRTSGSYRFLADPRRLNVALSRARDRIFIVGCTDYTNRNTLLSSIFKYCVVEEHS